MSAELGYKKTHHVLQYHEIAEEYIGKHGRNIILIINILALGSLAVVQIIACASDIHILNANLNKRDWALVFGVCPRLSSASTFCRNVAAMHAAACRRSCTGNDFLHSYWLEGCSVIVWPHSSRTVRLGPGSGHHSSSDTGKAQILHLHHHPHQSHFGSSECALQALTMVTAAIPSLHNFRVWSFIGLLATTYTTWVLVGSAINHGPVRPCTQIALKSCDLWAYSSA